MERSVSYFLNLFFCFFLVCSFQTAYAAAGCCSHHKGVKGCDTASNHLQCNDGTNSPTCTCSGGTTSKTEKTTTKKTTPSTTTATTTSTTVKSTTETKKTKGCCSKHGGVAGCDSSGYSKCKDGTLSSTCKC